jgi:hypothetical protein
VERFVTRPPMWMMVALAVTAALVVGLLVWMMRPVPVTNLPAAGAPAPQYEPMPTPPPAPAPVAP